MARIRSVKPEFWDSPSTAKASLRARLLYIAMWNWADDWGIGDANAKRLLSFAFPSDGDSEVEPRNFRHLAEELVRCYGVRFYEVEGREYYEIPAWEEHQRTEKRATRRNPPASQAETVLYDAASEDPSLDRGTPADGTGERGKGNRGTVEGGTSTADAVDAPQSTALALADRSDVTRVCEHLADRIEANGAKRPAIGKAWHDAARLLIDRDGRTEQEVHAAIDWCQADEFWRANVLSMPKLREKYDTLRLQAQRQQKPTRRGDIDWDAAAQRAAARDAQGAM